MVKVSWTEEALQWLEEIFEYIATENPQAATRVVAGIFERAQILVEFPEIGYRYQPSRRAVRILLLRPLSHRVLKKVGRWRRHSRRVSCGARYQSL